PWELTVKWMRRRPAIVALSTAVLLVAISGIAGVFWEWRAAEANAQRAKNQEKAALLARDEADEQRKKAEGNEHAANLANEKLRAALDAARRNAYCAHMNLAQREWDAVHIPRVLELLEGERPKQGETDLRGFEWFYLNRLCHSDLLTLRGHFFAVSG